MLRLMLRIASRAVQSRLLAVAAMLLAVACTTDKTTPPPCPEIDQLKDAASVTQFLGQAEDLTDAVFEAKIDGVRSKCFYAENGIRTELSVQFSAIRAPKLTGDRVGFRYFVAVTGPNREPIAREEFDVEIDMSGNRVRNLAVDEIEPFIPLKEGENGNFYRIYVGIVLTEQQLKYNRRTQ